LKSLSAAVLAAFCAAAPAKAQDHQADFDFYVLALSWSPSFCRSEAGEENPRQCDGDTPYGFIVHGLWPQFERGYPEYCPTRYPDRVPREMGEPYFDIMPGMGLIGHQWRKHGTCTGLSPADYLETTREAFERVTIPEIFGGDEPLRDTPEDFEAAFIAANPALEETGIAATCRSGDLAEIRICLTRDLAFRACPEVDADACERPEITLPPIDDR
jgi:ribonuclease T2